MDATVTRDIDRNPTKGLRRVEQIMGMPIGIDVRDPGVDPAVLDEAFDWFRAVDRIFSTYRPESEISGINAGALSPDDAHPDVWWVLERCEELRAETGGYFDIWTDSLPIELRAPDGSAITGGIDPSGLVKGWSVDRAAALLEAAGAWNYSINAGGDIRLRGGALPEAVWSIGIQHPLERDQIAAVVEADDLAIATSGTYARGAHIANPHTGRAPEGVLSVTVTGPDLATADAYATAVFAMGTDGPQWIAGLFGYEAMIVMADHTVLSTQWFPKV